MCKCTPSNRTPFCGKPGCEMPGQKPDGARLTMAAALADLPESVAQEAGEFYENFAPGRTPRPLKAEAMQHAWEQVIRPYLLGKRDDYPAQRRPQG